MPGLRTLAFLSVCGTLAAAGGCYAKSAVEEIGDYMQVIVPAYALGLAMNERDWEGAKQFAYGFAATEVGVYGLKAVVRERRPDGSNNHSFPSGHTAAAFSGAAFIHKRYGLKRAAVPYLMAAFTGYSRITADKHYLHDVLAGAAIGGLLSWFIAGEYDGLQISAGPQSVKIGFKTKF
ncbi:MAG: phosphatase PAP2 family protein [Rickettsiales bacterium]|nr:phosphatase PAP2 family protein [Rickettsiales bacterium]